MDLQLPFFSVDTTYRLRSDLRILLELESNQKALSIYEATKVLGSTQYTLELISSKTQKYDFSLWQVSSNFKYLLQSTNGNEGEKIEIIRQQQLIGSQENNEYQLQKLIEVTSIFPAENEYDLKRINSQIQIIYEKCLLCHYFISNEDICFQSFDNLFIIYNMRLMKETSIFSLNQNTIELLLPLTFQLERFQNIRMLLFEGSQLTFFLKEVEDDFGDDAFFQGKKLKKTISVTKLNWFHRLSAEQAQIKLLEFDENLNSGFYYQPEIGKLVIMRSFNYYLWKQMNRIKEHQMSKLTSKKAMILNQVQLPNGNTLIHAVYNEADSLKVLFSILKEERTYLPILNDYSKNGGRNIFHDYLDKIKEIFKQEDNLRDRIIVNQRMGLVIDHLSKCPFNLCMINFSPLFQYYIQFDENNKGMDIILKFLLSRCQHIDLLKNIKSGSFDASMKPFILIEEFQVYSYRGNFSDRVQEKDGSQQDIRLGLLDINLYEVLTQEKDILFQFLEKIESCQDDKLFLNPIYEGIIEQKWKEIQFRICVFVLPSYIAFMVLFYLYTIYDLETQYWIQPLDRDEITEEMINTYKNFGYVFRAFMLLLIAYFIGIDGHRIKQNGLMKSFVWNLISLCLYLLIYFGELLRVYSKYNEIGMSRETGMRIDRIIRILYSFATLFVWVKFLYFFRVKEGTGYYIRMIVETFVDIISFLFIFFSIVLCFAQAFYIFLLNTKVDRQNEALITGADDHTFDGIFDAIIFAYLMNFGVLNYSPDYFGSYQTWVSWVFFILGQITLTIVLLNFLIAIVNDTYNKIKERKMMYTNKDKFKLMQENSLMVLDFFECRKCRRRCSNLRILRLIKWLYGVNESQESSRFLLVGQLQEENQLEQVSSKINHMDTEVQKMLRTINQRVGIMSKKINEIYKEKRIEQGV